MKVTVHNFFKETNGYKYIKDNKIYSVSVEMFECFKRQYKQMGWYMFDFNFVVSFSYAHENIEEFLKKLPG